MKASDISRTPLVQRYGVRGAKLFARIWFSLLYLLLVTLAAGLWIVGPEFSQGGRRILIGGLTAALLVLAASLLTRMRLRYWEEIDRLERTDSAP